MLTARSVLQCKAAGAWAKLKNRAMILTTTLAIGKQPAPGSYRRSSQS